MIIFVYFLFLHPGEYTESKYDSTLFRLEYIAFRCGRSLFVATVTIGYLHSKKCMTLTFVPQKNGVRGNIIVHKASGDPLLFTKCAQLWRSLHMRDKNATPSTYLARVMTPIVQWKI